MMFSTKIRRGSRTFLIAAICLTFSIFGWNSHLAAQAPIIKNIQVTTSNKAGISNKDMENICTAAISTLFDQPTAMIRVDGVEKGLMHLSYSLPADSTLWQYKCRIEGKKIMWATRDGAWRTDTSDRQVTFQLTKDEIVVNVEFPDGSEKQNRFPR